MQTDVADVTVAGVSCKDSLVWHGRTELSCVVMPPFASLVLGEPFVGNVTVITYSGAPRAVPPPPTNYIVQPCMFWRPKGCSRAPWPEPDTLLPPLPCPHWYLACRMYASEASCSAAAAKGFGCHWCPHATTCLEAPAECDYGCVPGGMYMTCSELAGIIVLTITIAALLAATAYFAHSRERLMDYTSDFDVYGPTVTQHSRLWYRAHARRAGGNADASLRLGWPRAGTRWTF